MGATEGIAVAVVSRKGASLLKNQRGIGWIALVSSSFCYSMPQRQNAAMLTPMGATPSNEA